jgi:D-aspartate ligase
LGAGAVVIGGDYQGLGMARNLGRRGVPVYVLDDELSIARFSRYTRRTVRVHRLRDEPATVDAVLAIGTRFHLGGWALYPTRDEMVAALSRQRAALAGTFRVAVPEWSAVRHAWGQAQHLPAGGSAEHPDTTHLVSVRVP